jgi:hypothetical protein
VGTDGRWWGGEATVASPQPWVTDGRSQSDGAVEVKEGEEEDKGEADNGHAEAVT